MRPQLSPDGRPAALGPGEPLRHTPPLSGSACPGRPTPRHAVLRAARAGSGRRRRAAGGHGEKGVCSSYPRFQSGIRILRHGVDVMCNDDAVVCDCPALSVVPPEPLLRWQRQGWRWCWRWRWRPGRPQRPAPRHALRREIVLDLAEVLQCLAQHFTRIRPHRY
jgi:hypothetical protein